MSDILGRHTNKCDLCNKNGTCPQCKGKGFVVEDLDGQIQKGIRLGDILLIQYRFDPVGWIIRLFTHCQWNHVAWFTNDKDLIELKAIGKKKTPFKKYMNKWLYKCKIVRPLLDNCKVKEAVDRANKAIFNYPYSSAILNFILIGLKITKKLPRLSCSGFIAYYLAQVGFYFDGEDTWFVTPKDIEISKKVENIKLKQPPQYPSIY